jgi:hypothetical protein
MIRTCVICDTEVCVEKEGWDACVSPGAACGRCAELLVSGDIPWQLARMLYYLRCQVSSLAKENQEMKKDLERMFKAQKEIEQEVLRL